MMITIDDYGYSISVKNRCFWVESEAGGRQFSPNRVSAIHLRKHCDISSAALALAADSNIPLLIFSNAGKVKARVWRPHFGSHAEIRRRQVYWSDSPEGLAWVRDRLVQKTEGQLKILVWLAGRVTSHAAALGEGKASMADLLLRLQEFPVKVSDDESKATIRSLEARLAKLYWDSYFRALERFEAAEKRSRQPAQDPLNALLNYGYGILYGEVEGAALTAGLDPQMSAMHREEFGKPAFVFDAIEPFRPWMERLIAELAIGGEMKSDWFSVEGEAVWLRKEGKRVFIPQVMEMLATPTTLAGRKIKRRDQILQSMRDLAQGFLDQAGKGEKL
jgi:CRISPR-associated protein Cas1